MYTYDNGGNIIQKTAYPLDNVTDFVESTQEIFSYNNVWKDQMSSINGGSCEYDSYGNPTKYKDNSLIWNRVNHLLQYGNKATFTYNGLGQIVERTYLNNQNTVTVNMLYDANGRLIKETFSQPDGTGDLRSTDNFSLVYLYSANELIGFTYLDYYNLTENKFTFYYKKNAFGDIIGITDVNNFPIASYFYDAWGNCKVEASNTSINNGLWGNTQNLTYSRIANCNPFRYRGYYYNKSIGLYHLQTRYYDPQTGRFISPDTIEYLDPENIGGLNLYSYCYNNPIMYADPTGHIAISAFLIGLAVSSFVGWGLSEIFGSQIVGGVGSIIGGGNAILTGISLCAFGPWGIIAGIILIAVGGFTIAFGVNEIVDGAFGTNYIQEWTGWSDEVYNDVYFGLNVASTAGSIVGNIGMRIAANNILNRIVKNPQKFQNYRLWQLKTYGKYTTQYVPGTLRKGGHIGQGYTLTHVKGATNGYIQWHPGSRHHYDGLPYLKVTSSLGGTWRGLYLF